MSHGTQAGQWRRQAARVKSFLHGRRPSTKPIGLPVLANPAPSAISSHHGGLVKESNDRWARSLNRRNALRAMGGFLTGSPLLRGQQDPFRDHPRIPSLNEMVTSFDFEPVAYSKVLRYNYDYMAYGTDSEFTLRRNREAFDWVQLVSKRVLDATPIQPATEVLGTKMAFP